MNLSHKIQNWEHSRHDTLVLVARVVLGIVITIKGVIFLSNISFLDSLLRHSALYRFAESFWVWYIVLTSLFCGVFIVTGLFTKIVTGLQIPVLAGALLFINPGDRSFSLNREFVLSFFILILLIYFFFKGPGKISMDNYLRNHDL